MRTLYDGDAWFPRISPDGKHVAFEYRATDGSRGAGSLRIGIVAAAGGVLEKSIELPASAAGNLNLRWTPDGRSVAYIDGRGNTENIWVQPVSGGKPKQLTHFTDGDVFNFAWSRDGKMLALARGTTSSDAVLFTSAK